VSELQSNSRSPCCHSCVLPRMMWLLKLPFDQNPIIINHKSNCDLRAISFMEIQEGLVALL
jgi:hypothetical protein